VRVRMSAFGYTTVHSILLPQASATVKPARTSEAVKCAMLRFVVCELMLLKRKSFKAPVMLILCIHQFATSCATVSLCLPVCAIAMSAV
jgi:hypothetical protein